MAPSKKKPKTSSKAADSSTAVEASTPASSSSQASSSRAAPKPGQQAQLSADHTKAAAVSSRPKRNAEKKKYDDSEDDRPQHLSAKRSKKKKGERGERAPARVVVVGVGGLNRLLEMC